MTSKPVIRVENLAKRYGNFEALKGISFDVYQGQILGLLGPNGAGKSTTMKILTSYISASGGSATIDGLDLFADSLEIRKRIGYLPESTPLYTDMLVFDYLLYVGEMRGIDRQTCTKRIHELAGRVGIVEKIGDPIHTLSKGYKQRVGLAQALLHKPKILILDEPTSGLDPNQIVEIRHVIKELGADHTIILSTHILPEVRATCDRIVIVHHGEVVADGSIEELDGRVIDSHQINLAISDKKGVTASDICADLKDLEGVSEVEPSGFGSVPEPHHNFEVTASADIRPQISKWAFKKKHTLVELRRNTMDLESIFQRLTTQA
jgi:ABC-2 type transport system ATP-binding protein